MKLSQEVMPGFQRARGCPTHQVRRSFASDIDDRRALAEAIVGLGGNPLMPSVATSASSNAAKTALTPGDLQAMAPLPTDELAADHPPAHLTLLANALSAGTEVAQDEARAVELWNAAASAGDVMAAHRLALAQYTGRGTPADPTSGLAKLEEMADEQQHPPSQYVVAKIMQGKAEDDAAAAPALYARALALYLSAAKNGVVSALHNVANMYAAGHGTPDGGPDLAAAAKYYQTAAELGDPVAMFTLATWYSAGKAGPVDDEAAFRWHLQAAQAGLPRAQFNTGAHYLHGKGTAQDLPKAAEFFRLAAERGMAEACVNLSEMKRLGMGTPDGQPRREEARQWLERAVGLGNDMAKDLLRVMDTEEEAYEQLVAQEEASETPKR